jgi:hypothetical protein
MKKFLVEKKISPSRIHSKELHALTKTSCDAIEHLDKPIIEYNL